ncbi:MAG: bifunctional folylpolyglutamate synthase/dihydrofolate synthase [Deltaproteobacteria bacterium]|nr:bifunctional folylpolyglutamate synthase/dihydrofolate synthase [Deltaproteobacteria bacterium]
MSSWTRAHLDRDLARRGESRMVLGLNRMRTACVRLGSPERRVPAVHIAGTNGKGSTGAFLRSLLRAAGYRVAHYSSPHLSDFAERYWMDGASVPEPLLLAQAAAVAERTADLALTYFEFATCVAFRLFAATPIDVAILEVGLGGRLDATNVVTPRCAVLTPIGWDHMAVLGSSLGAIAAEKCGIIKPGVPVVAALQSAEVMAVIRATCRERGSTLTIAEPVPAGTPLGLAGAHQRINAGVAVVAARRVRAALNHESVAPAAPIPGAALTPAEVAALAATEWPGRCEWLSETPPILFDGAHNPAGAAALAAYLRRERQGRRIVCCLGMQRDKDVEGVARALCEAVDAWIAVPTENERGLTATRLADRLCAVELSPVPMDSVADAVAEARRASPPPLTVITGSLTLYRSARHALRCAR